MRLWTLHPKYLDPPGLVALWRESLLAQKVLQGETRGYREHPQLIRFRAHPNSIAAYLIAIHAEAVQRGYAFDASKIQQPFAATAPLRETQGQILYEWNHLLRKLQKRAPQLYKAHQQIAQPEPHPLFVISPGPIAGWERARQKTRNRTKF